MEKSWSKFLAFAWVIAGSFARLLPHLPNVTPTVSVGLFAGKQLSKLQAISSVFVMMVISDFFLAKLHGHEVFGYWTLFTYSGLLMVVLAGRGLSNNFGPTRAAGFTLGASFAFWLWTNFGTWLVSGMYTLDTAGLALCFTTAIPFLGASLVGDLAWMLILFMSYQGASSLMKRSDAAVVSA